MSKIFILELSNVPLEIMWRGFCSWNQNIIRKLSVIDY